MTIATVFGWDATGANLPNAPKTGQGATYVTGSGSVPATAAQLAARPGILKYDQSPTETAIDFTLDLFDFENGCLTLGILADVIKKAQANYAAKKTPGQRDPGVYMSRSDITLVVNTLIKGGVTSCPLVVADWNNNPAQAAAEVAGESGPFPIVGRQYANRGPYDLDVWSVPWVSTRAGQPPGAARGEYVTAGMYSLEQLAAKLGVPPATLLRQTAVHYGTFGDPLAGYLNAIHAGTKPASTPLPKGIKFWAG